MGSIISKIISALFVLLIYYFIFIIVRMIYLDIRVMGRKKAGLPTHDAYLKPINQPHNIGFKLEESYPILEDNIIGRHKSCSLYFPDNFMSHKHSRIFVEKDGYYLEDLGSTNGTFLNGQAIKDEAIELLSGDKIQIGQIEFLFIRPHLEKGEVKI